jgi:hypothetical protein
LTAIGLRAAPNGSLRLKPTETCQSAIGPFGDIALAKIRRSGLAKSRHPVASPQMAAMSQNRSAAVDPVQAIRRRRHERPLAAEAVVSSFYAGCSQHVWANSSSFILAILI